jgi:hypothetical protein
MIKNVCYKISNEFSSRGEQLGRSAAIFGRGCAIAFVGCVCGWR